MLYDMSKVYGIHHHNDGWVDDDDVGGAFHGESNWYSIASAQAYIDSHQLLGVTIEDCTAEHSEFYDFIRVESERIK